MTKLYHIYNENFEITHAQFFEEGEQPSNAVYIENCDFIKPMVNSETLEVYEGATPEENESYNRSLIPTELSRMKFKKQIRRSTIYTYDVVLEYLKNLTITELFTEDDRQDIIDDFEDCAHFERYNPKFIMLANMLGVSDEIKDEIFINGNLIE